MFIFEWRYFTKQPSFYISALIFFSIAVLATSQQKLVTSFGSNIHINGAFYISQVMATLGMFALFLVVNFIANTALRDHGSNMAEILYSKPIKPLDYQLGRFLGSFAVIVCIFSMVPLGLIFGSFMPWVAQERLGAFNLSYYLTTFFYLSVPTLLVFSCLFYAVALRLKSMMSVYLSVIAVFVLYSASNSMFLSHQAIAALLDPFGIQTLAEVTRYWTVFEKNNQMLSFEGTLLQSRMIWVAIAIVVMVTLGRLTKPLTLTNKKSAKTKVKTDKTNQSGASFLHNSVHYKGSVNASCHQFIARTIFEIKQVIFTPAFIVLCSAVFVTMVAILFQPKGMFGTSNLPITQIMVRVIKGSMSILSTIVITYYSAEVIWRERLSGMGDIIDSSPVLNVSFWLSKLVAVWLVLFGLLGFAMIVTISYQLGNGINALDLAQYFIGLFYFLALPWMMLTVLAFFLQVISPNKYVGMFLFVLFLASSFAMGPLGFGHNMFRFAKSPTLPYTDLNGFGWSLLSHGWYMLYWGALSVALSVIGYGLWQRGPVQLLKSRIRHINYQIGNKGKMALVACALVFVMSGSFIFYNTRVLNDYQPMAKQAIEKAHYEKNYGNYADAPVPTISKLTMDVELYPTERKVVVDADIVLTNKTSKAINRFLVSIPYYTPEHFTLEIDGGKLSKDKGELNTYWFVFEQPLLPGKQRTGSYQITRQHHGFVDYNSADSEFNIVENGSFFEGYAILPLYGYNRSMELIDPAVRKKFALPPPKRAHKLEESAYYGQNTKGPDIGFIEFEATVSTSADQVMIAPGSLKKQWQDQGRNYFHYKSDAPIQNFIAFMSARFEVRSTKHNGIDIEIYYHKDHAENIGRMEQGVKDSLDYFIGNFGPYPHRQVRIVEFPGYRNFAQSFPSTIAFSETVGFITDLRNENEIDQIYYVIAHEMAHQWWGNQVEGANVQGSTMISETLSQYSALMLFKQKYGDKKFRRILKLELDQYLSGRANEIVEELPLMRVEDQQYIHYRKGSVIMMSLVDLLGEKRMNNALASFLEKFKFNEKRYPTTLDLMSFISQDASKQELEFIKSTFEQINLYDLKAKKFSVKELDDNQFEVTLTIEAHRMNADGQGVETPVALSEPIDIGLFLGNPDDITTSNNSSGAKKPLYLRKHLITDGENTIKMVVSARPLFAGIDPYIKLIDRDSNDNVIKL